MGQTGKSEQSVKRKSLALWIVVVLIALASVRLFASFAEEPIWRSNFQKELVLRTISKGYLPFVPVCRDANGKYKEIAGELEPGFQRAVLLAGKSKDIAQPLQPGFDGVSVLVPYNLWHSKDAGAAVDAPDMRMRYDLTMRAAGENKDCGALAALVAKPQKD